MSKPTAVPAATTISPKMGAKTERCTHRFAASGRQCRLLTSDPSGLCAQHLAKRKAAAQNANFADLLFTRADNMQTAQGINRSLVHLYQLLAEDRISVRRAQTLAYISSLVLRTLPAIDHENHHNIGSDAYQAALAKQSATATSAANAPASSASVGSPVAAAPFNSAPAIVSAGSSSVSSAPAACCAVASPIAVCSAIPAVGPNVLTPTSVSGSPVALGSTVASASALDPAIPDPPRHTKPS